MMDKDNIIKSGILEQYLLGELDQAQQLEVENALNSSPELKTYFNALETSFETLGFENAITPPEAVKTNLLKTIKSQANVKPNSLKEPSNNLKTYLSIAASLAAILLIGFMWLYTQFNNTEERLRVVETEKEILTKDLKGLSDNLETLQKWYTMVSSPDTKQYVLSGNTLSPNSKLISYVNHTTKSVVVNTAKLPDLESDKDYQMWADVEGEMINMGIIDTKQDMLAMTYIDRAESLNITIEPAGGNDHPTVSRLISNVYLQP